ncbi:cation diffusion facilitator family transporter [Sinomonas mesophila]|uniref:cation diffusion facilitator family transporter n=1 Tax=Sinomonas mesophila TaxID=1531955 RepID=UPI000984585C|nr:cation diffusion facilitator family transporter [Sinomonas mesophila]
MSIPRPAPETLAPQGGQRHEHDHGDHGHDHGGHEHPHGASAHEHGHGDHGHPHPHGHGHGDHGHPHPHGHGHGDHGHPHPHGHGHGHEHGTGFWATVKEFFVPHTHDASDSIDDALEASAEGVRALKISLLVLLATTVLQFIVVAFSGSVALLADTVHNFSDAMTAVPLWIAFILARRAASKRYTYGLGRAEDLAGLFIILVITVSAIVAGWQSVERIFNPQPLENLWWVVAAGVIGFAGNEAVAIFRIRVGRRIGSAALVADGIHARTDGFTSLAVVLGAFGVMLGFPLADPIVGLLISITIFVLLWGTIRSIGRRLLDGIEPDLVNRAEHALKDTPGILGVQKLQLRWIGHRIHGTAVVGVAPGSTVEDADRVRRQAQHRLGHALPNVEEITVATSPS